jgi:hypothetical protein
MYVMMMTAVKPFAKAKCDGGKGGFGQNQSELPTISARTRMMLSLLKIND